MGSSVTEESLNPCFNGRYSLSASIMILRMAVWSLNPCFNGRYSLSYYVCWKNVLLVVLILVLMEDTH